MSSGGVVAALTREVHDLRMQVTALNLKLTKLPADVAVAQALKQLTTENAALRRELADYRIADASTGPATRECSIDTSPPTSADGEHEDGLFTFAAGGAEGGGASAAPPGKSGPAAPPPPTVTVQVKHSVLWVGYRYPASPGIIGYEV